MLSNFMRKKRQAGVGIVDAMLGIAVGAVILTAAFVGYKSSSTNSKNQAIETAVQNLVEGIQSKWSGLGSYSGISAAGVNNAGVVIKPLTYNGTNILMADGSTLAVASATPFTTFTTTFAAPAGGTCAQILSNMAADITDATVAGVDVFTSGALDPAKVNTNCVDLATIVLTSH